MKLTDDEKHMKRALRKAKEALALGEVPVGCVIVREGKVIATGRNMRETRRSAVAHAEINAINAACRKVGAWRLCDCELYVTLEPCPMCAGAIINARIKRVIWGAPDKKAGAFGSVADISEFDLNHSVEVCPGVLESECAELISEFFRALRVEKKKPVNNNTGDE